MVAIWSQIGSFCSVGSSESWINAPPIPDSDAAIQMGEEIISLCPEISDEVVVKVKEIGDDEVVGRDVGQISPIELHEAALEENHARARVGLQPRHFEHPDGHKGDEDDGNDAMFGFLVPLDVRTHIKKKEAIPDTIPFQDVMPAPPLPSDTSQTEIEYGSRGNWGKIHVPKGIREEDLNRLISDTLGKVHVATPDYTGSPIEGQMFRFFPDVCHSTPIWITLRQGSKRQNLTMVMRVSRESTQSEIEEAASDFWGNHLEFRNFPRAFDATVSHWMHPRRETDD
jgi:hypothetical protein